MAVPRLDLEKLTSEEKLQLIEQIRASLEADVPVPDWHRRELERRLADLDPGDATGIPWEQVVQEIQSRFK